MVRREIAVKIVSINAVVSMAEPYSNVMPSSFHAAGNGAVSVMGS